ncbi:hypothetical protein BRADI_1g19434v3 [Brachypodium distachyon]|uniref:BLE2 protein n=1 Tax=Brachypodium distachyon TaxID=15368 RepID=A0A2K2DK37_BRADI|nr:hypothetical protein BRADI_1g19434v3 [Brachypodium distachyon]
MADDVAEHRVHMPAANARGWSNKAPATDPGKSSNNKAPEKWLNGFIRAVALMERVGNALGTLAFTWATVVLLGGYAKDLGSEDDFWFATTIVYLEAARMFTRKNRMEYQLFFNTRGAFRPIGWTGLIVMVPAAVLRVALPVLRFDPIKSNTEYDKNLKASLTIFYGMVLGQGTLYGVACAVEFFSFIPRRSLVRSAGLRGNWGLESINLYYAYAFEKCMQDGVLAPKKTSLSTFAMDSVNSDSSKNQVYGFQMMNSFLQTEPTKEQLLSKLTICTKTTARIIRMLDWTSPKDATIRLYAAKVTSELAKNLRVVAFPGAVQLVAALLDADSTPRRGNPLLDTDDEQEDRQDPFLSTEDNQKEEDDSTDASRNQLQRQDQLQDADNLLQTETSPTQQVGINTQNSMVRCLQRISEFCSIPKELPLTNHDLLPALAMSIIVSLAGCDQDNCVEISKAADLIPKIVEFTSYRNHTMIIEAQQKVLLLSSLKVLQQLTSIGGKIGITLRNEIADDPFLLKNLKEILGDGTSSPEFRKLVAAILRNLAVDGNTRKEIGRIRLIIAKLMQAFIDTEGTMSNNVGLLLRKVAGQALAMLTIESVHTCSIILKEPEFMKELKTMILIHDDNYMYVAVLERIMDAEGVELEILVGLSSQICKVIPGDFTRELDDGHINQRFVKRLVHALIANKKPSAHCPGIRRVILEQVIYMTECNSCYADCFKKCRMNEALLMVEQTLSKVENYRLFLGNTGFMECSTPISALVARAKELLGCD